MPDWTQFAPYLQQLGPWGWVVIVAVVVIQRLRNRPAPTATTPVVKAVPGEPLPLQFFKPAVAEAEPAVLSPSAGLTEADQLVALKERCVAAMEAHLAKHDAESAKIRAALQSAPAVPLKAG